MGKILYLSCTIFIYSFFFFKTIYCLAITRVSTFSAPKWRSLYRWPVDLSRWHRALIRARFLRHGARVAVDFDCEGRAWDFGSRTYRYCCWSGDIGAVAGIRFQFCRCRITDRHRFCSRRTALCGRRTGRDWKTSRRSFWCSWAQRVCNACPRILVGYEALISFQHASWCIGCSICGGNSVCQEENKPKLQNVHKYKLTKIQSRTKLCW